MVSADKPNLVIFSSRANAIRPILALIASEKVVCFCVVSYDIPVLFIR